MNLDMTLIGRRLFNYQNNILSSINSIYYNTDRHIQKISNINISNERIPKIETITYDYSTRSKDTINWNLEKINCNGKSFIFPVQAFKHQVGATKILKNTTNNEFFNIDFANIKLAVHTSNTAIINDKSCTVINADNGLVNYLQVLDNGLIYIMDVKEQSICICNNKGILEKNDFVVETGLDKYPLTDKEEVEKEIIPTTKFNSDSAINKIYLYKPKVRYIDDYQYQDLVYEDYIAENSLFEKRLIKRNLFIKK